MIFFKKIKLFKSNKNVFALYIDWLSSKRL